LDNVRAVAESHGWFNFNEKRGGPPTHPCPDKKCQTATPTQDTACPQNCFFCPEGMGQQYPLCDCCDRDCAAYPGSPYASGSPVACGNDDDDEGAGNDDDDYIDLHDYNCNGCVQKFGACVGAEFIHACDSAKCKKHALGADQRELFVIPQTNITAYDQPWCAKGFDTTDGPYQGCAYTAGACNALTPGWDYNPGGGTKRSPTVDAPAPDFCVGNPVQFKGAAGDLQFNDCALFAYVCYDLGGGKCGTQDEFCLKIGQ
jgi:hypothetical protein